MKKTFLRKLVIGFSSAILLIYGTIYACSDDGDWGWSFDSNFTPETFVDNSYSSLFLSQDIFYGIRYDNEHNSRFNDEIVQDWSKYLKGNLKQENVSYFLIDSSGTAVAKLYDFFKSAKPNSTSEKWNEKCNLKDKKIKNFIEFLYYSKQVEKASTNNNRWEYEETKNKKTITDLDLIKTIQNKYNSTSDAFLKNRYWFQTIKAYFYSNDLQNATAFFDKTSKTVPKNNLYYRAVSYLAGLEYKQKNYAKANFLYSQVFDKCPEMRLVATFCFHPQEQKDWDQSLAMAKTIDQKAALWAIHGYYTDERTAIEKIYELNPKCEYLEFLVTRLINKQEIKQDKYTTDKNKIDEFNKTNDSLSKVNLALVDRIAKEEKTTKPYLWYVAAGYLQTLNKNYTLAENYFDKAESTMPKTILAINQIRLLRFVNNLSKIDKINSDNDKTILKDLAWLYNELPKQNIENFRYQNASAWSKIYLSGLYKAQNNPVMAELFARNLDFYNNEQNLLSMKAFLSKENKTSIEKTGVGVYNVNLNDINGYQAVKATFQNKIPEAIVFMQQTETTQKAIFLGNPFNGNIKDCHDCDFDAPQKKKYSQLDFLTTIKTMQDKITAKEDVYINCILLGNAFYNITHFGNARMFYEGTIIGSGSSPYDFKSPIKEMITNCSLSKMYYQKAFLAAKNDEQKAKCQYMLAKCERNEYYNKKYSKINNWWEIEDDKENFIAWYGFKSLKKDYSKTKYYQEVIAECGYFNTYLGENKK